MPKRPADQGEGRPEPGGWAKSDSEKLKKKKREKLKDFMVCSYGETKENSTFSLT
jgi:hypothetical protein